jgi:hypothetical protein
MRRPRLLLHIGRLIDDVLFWPALALVVWGELVWMPGRGWFGLFAHVNDKILHFFAYFALGSMAAAGLKGRQTVIVACLCLIGLGILLEFVQAYVGRDKSAYDAIANTAGVVLGGSVARAIVEPLRKRFPPS